MMKAQGKRMAGLIAVAILAAGPARPCLYAGQAGKGGSSPGASRVVLIGGLNALAGVGETRVSAVAPDGDPASPIKTVGPDSQVSAPREGSPRAAASEVSMRLPGIQAAVSFPEAAGPREEGAPAPRPEGLADPAASMSGPSSESSLAGAAHQGRVGFDGAKKDSAPNGSPNVPGEGGPSAGAESLRRDFAADGSETGPDPRHGFSRFHPEQIRVIGAAGRIVLSGAFKRPHWATVRSEAAKGPGPRIFVSFFIQPRNTEAKSEGAERPMSRRELEDLKAALKEYQRRNYDDPSGEFYDQMIGRIEAELAPAAPPSNQGPAGPSTARSASRSPGLAGAIDPRIEQGWARQLRKRLSRGGFKNVKVALSWDGPAGMAGPSNIVKVMIPLLEGEQTANVGALYRMLQAASGKEEFSWLKKEGMVWEIAVEKVKRGKVETKGGAFRDKIPFPGKPVEKERAREMLAGLPAGTLIMTYSSPMKGVVPFEGALGVSPMEKGWAVMFLEAPGWRLYERSAPKNGGPAPQNLYLQYTES